MCSGGSRLPLIGDRLIASSLIVQFALAPFLAHGYDLLVSIVAARNVLSRTSPYEGGALPNPSYQDEIQGIGELPLWPLILAAAEALSMGNIYIFNLLSKIPIISANIMLAILLRRSGATGWSLFLLNPYILMVTAAWGKPDGLAALLSISSLLLLSRPGVSGVLLALSLCVKPLALPLAPLLASHYSTKSARDLLVFLGSVAASFLTFFLMPFLLLGWSLSTPMGGLGNWFKIAGGISPWGLVEHLYGSQELRGDVAWAGYISPAFLVLFGTFSILRRPRERVDIYRYALLGTAMFILSRTWISEQNLVIILALMVLTSGRTIPKHLWILPFILALLNTSPIQLLYPLWPSVVSDFYSWIGRYIEGLRLIAKFAASLSWLAATSFYISSLFRDRMGDEG